MKIGQKNVTFRRKNAPPTGDHVFSPIWTIFKLVREINKTNVLTNFHDDWAKIVTSRVFTRKTIGHEIFELDRDFIGTKFLTKFHEDRKINVASRDVRRTKTGHKSSPEQSGELKNAPPPGGHVFKATKTIFGLIKDIFGTNLLTKFHKDRNINVASRVLTRFHYRYIRKNAPPLGSHVFQANVTIFELIQDIIETNLLTKFHEDWTINVASRVLTRKNSPPPLIIGTNLLTKKNAPPPGGHIFQPTGIIFSSPVTK
ncbi:hypothetical protein DPMN_095483 [Dreissena polymorpha]|uniref:Uncharacterized protein n=1 Tax=Dreissena polymorpha TaxID=45954 RepID=A0A9D4R3V2_DREPO|nr:hypothetical protein DPMN_095483 [Dreissena polymorpha]